MKLIRHCGLKNSTIPTSRFDLVGTIPGGGGNVTPATVEMIAASNRLLRAGQGAPAVAITRDLLISMAVAPLGLTPGGTSGSVVTDADSVSGASWEPTVYWGKPGSIPRTPLTLVVVVPLDVFDSGAKVPWGNLASLAAAFGSVWGQLQDLGVHVYICEMVPTISFAPLVGPVPIRGNTVRDTPDSLGGSNLWDDLSGHPLGGVGGRVYWAHLGGQPLEFGTIGGGGFVGNFGYISVYTTEYDPGSPPPFLSSSAGLQILSTVDVPDGLQHFRIDVGYFSDKAAAHGPTLAAVAACLDRFQFTFWTPDTWTFPWDSNPALPTTTPTTVASLLGRPRQALPDNPVSVGDSDDSTNAAAAAAVAGAIVTDAMTFFTS